MDGKAQRLEVENTGWFQATHQALRGGQPERNGGDGHLLPTAGLPADREGSTGGRGKPCRAAYYQCLIFHFFF